MIGDKRTKDFDRAHEIIKKAKRICFLGFGYSKDNLDRLNIKLMQGKEVIGSAYKLEDAERLAVRRYFRKSNVTIDLGDKNDKSLLFLRKRLHRNL